MSAHTPGPWKTRRDPNGALDVYGGMEFVCTFGHAEGANPDRIEADGRLIAAAPELLERLKVRVKECPCCGDPDFPTEPACVICRADGVDIDDWGHCPECRPREGETCEAWDSRVAARRTK